MDIFKKYNFNITNDISKIKTEKICYFKFRRNIINNLINNNKPLKLNQKLLCVKYMNKNKIRLFVNYEYTLIDVDKDNYYVSCDEDDKVQINKKIFWEYFSYPYAQTCHSIQGLTIDKKITIFDCNTCYVDRYFIWTAITRATNLNDISIFEHTERELNNLCISKVKQYFGFKIENYKLQDKEKNYKYDKEKYINGDVFYKMYLDNKYCSCCNKLFEFNFNGCNIESDITLDRLDNNLPHLNNNVRLCCNICNTIRSDNYDL